MARAAPAGDAARRLHVATRASARQAPVTTWPTGIPCGWRPPWPDHPALGETLSDALVGDHVVFPVRDPAGLRDLADPRVEVGDLSAGLDVGGGVVAHVVTVEGLLARRRGACRAARRG